MRSMQHHGGPTVRAHHQPGVFVLLLHLGGAALTNGMFGTPAAKFGPYSGQRLNEGSVWGPERPMATARFMEEWAIPNFW